MKILSVVGARPQFVKAAMVSRALRSVCHEVLLHTGQHYDESMSQVFFDELNLPQPEIYLGVGSNSHAEQTAQMMTGIERVLLEQPPNWVLVYGDTNSTLAGALAAAKLNIPVAHVEAGLRSFNRSMPEEINRVVTDHVSQALFCPTAQSVQNLAREGITQGVFETGDVMGDALEYFVQAAHRNSTILHRLDLKPKTYALATVHRAGNTDDPARLRAIMDALARLRLPVVFPVHPRTRKIIENLGIMLSDNVHAIEPVGYLDMLMLEANADAILTDSGGVQKEAYWLGVRCITLRDETEWVETVAAGWNRLVGADPLAIIDAVNTWQPNTERKRIYGDGSAAQKICQFLTGSPPAPQNKELE